MALFGIPKPNFAQKALDAFAPRWKVGLGRRPFLPSPCQIHQTVSKRLRAIVGKVHGAGNTLFLKNRQIACQNMPTMKRRLD